MPPDAVRAVLRAGWQRSAGTVEPVDGGAAAAAWLVDDHVLVRVAAPGRAQLEAGCGAAVHLAGQGLTVASPVRTQGGVFVALHEGGAYALTGGLPGRSLDGEDPLDQQWWGDLLGRVHRAMDGFHHGGLARWHWIRLDAPHLGVAPWLRASVAGAVAALTRLSVTDRLTYGVLHGDPLPGVFRLDPSTGATGLLRWGFAATGPLLFDLAGAVAYAGGVDHAAELVDGYASAGPVTREEIESALPVLLRFRWAVVADWHARALAAGGPGPATPGGSGPATPGGSAKDAAALEAARAELARFE